MESEEDLRQALQTWESTEGSIVDNYKHHAGRYQHKFGSRGDDRKIVCFNCGMEGHTKRQCQSQPEVKYHPQQPPKDFSHITCHWCGLRGHYMSSCPNWEPADYDKAEQKEDKLKETRSLRRTSITEEREEDIDVRALVEGKKVIMTLDTGAKISVLPTDIVSKENRTGEKVWVRGYRGDLKLRETAVVDMQVGDKWLKENLVALAPRDKLSGKGLLSIKLDDVTWHILVAQREKVVMPKCDARAVVT